MKPHHYVIPDFIKNDIKFRMKWTKHQLRRKSAEMAANASHHDGVLKIKIVPTCAAMEQQAVVCEPTIGHLCEVNLLTHEKLYHKKLTVSLTELHERQKCAMIIEKPIGRISEVAINPNYRFNKEHELSPSTSSTSPPTSEEALPEYITIEIGRCTMECAAKPLRANSAWFARFDKNLDRLAFLEAQVPMEAFKKVNDWVNNQIIALTQTNLVDVLQVARFLEIKPLSEKCWQLLMEPYFREAHAFEVYRRAMQHEQLRDVCQAMLTRIGNYFLPLVGSIEYLQLEIGDLIVLLKSHNIGVNSEMEVFFAAIRWLNYNQHQRSKFMRRVMCCVRFGNLSLSFIKMLLDHFEWKNKETDFQNIAALSEFVKLNSFKAAVEFGLQYLETKSEYGEKIAEFVEICKERDWRYCVSRKWIYDPKCEYHNVDLRVCQQNEITYAGFLEYIRSLQNYTETDLRAIRIVGE